MKFSIALGLLFAGLATCQQLQPVQPNVDSFLRQNQHLNPSTKLISMKQNGQLSTVTYKDGPVDIEYNVRSQDDQLKIVAIQKTFRLSNQIQFEPISAQDVPQNANNQKLPPLPLIMPHWNIEDNGQIGVRNVFDQIEHQINDMEKKMQEDRQNFEHIMGQKRIEMQQRFNKNFGVPLAETPLLGADDHDYKLKQNIQFDHPLIGGDHDYNWATQAQPQPLIGGGDHDYNWATIQFEQNQPLLGEDDHDFKWKRIEEQPLIGGGDHDNWVEKRNQEQIQFDHPIIGGDDHDNWEQKRKKYEFQFDHPIIGGDDHDNWKQKKGKHCKNLKQQNLFGGDQHDNWKHQKQWNGKHSSENKQRRHHSNGAWMSRPFSNQQVLPYLNEKIPDIIGNSQLVSIQNKGFEHGKGFTLQIQLKDKQGNLNNIEAFFKPRKQEFLINKISKVSQAQSSIVIGQQLVSRFIKGLEENNAPVVELEADKQIKNQQNIQTKDLIAPKPNLVLLGGDTDLDHDPQFMKIARSIEVKQDNYFKTEEVSLLGGQNDHDNIEKVEQDKKFEFDVTGLPLPGGETDIDNKIGFQELISKVMDIAQDIFEDKVQDIDETEDAEQKEEKLKQLIK